MGRDATFSASRPLKNSKRRSFDAKTRQFSESLVDLVKRRRTGV